MSDERENAGCASRRRRAWARVLMGAAMCVAVVACGTTITPSATVSLDPSISLTGAERLYVGWMLDRDRDDSGLPLPDRSVRAVAAYDGPISFPVEYDAPMVSAAPDYVSYVAWIDPAPCADASCPEPRPASGQHYGVARVPRTTGDLETTHADFTIDGVVP
jgi:hypothetical protein